MATPEERAHLAQKKYRASPRGKAASAVHNNSPEQKAWQKAYRQTERFKAWSKAYLAEYRNKPEQKAKRKAAAAKRNAKPESKAYFRERKFGITHAEQIALYERQGGCCASCHEPLKGLEHPRTHLDHNHETGQVRGFVCNGCNIKIGVYESAKFPLVKAFVDSFKAQVKEAAE